MSGQRLGKYEIQATLGKSARALVLRAVHMETQRAVAIKVIQREHVDARVVPAFKKSAAALAQVEHPGIARFIEVLETEKTVCLVSALAEGQPLAALLKDGAYPDARIAWEISRQVLEALAAAHLQGGVHRDLKPSNILFAADGRVTLVDFGTSILYAAPGEAIHCRSPEHFADPPVLTPRSDLYQVGALVYQLVTGQAPFSGSPAEVAQRVKAERPADPSSHNKKLAWQLDFVVQKAMAKNPAERYATGVELGEGLRLGLQDTVGRPLDPVKPPVAKAPGDAAKAAVDAGKAAPAPPSAPKAAPEPPKAAAAPAEPAKAAPNLVRNAKLVTPPAPAPTAAAAPKAAEPKAAEPGAAPAAVIKPALDPHKPVVLFVDDDARILNALKALFRQEYNVLCAEGGEAALALMGQAPVHVIVTDQRMPGMTGVELLRKVRELAPNTVRILLTGYTDLASLVGSINQGEIFRFVKKPWENDELRTALSDAAKIALELAGTPAPRAQSPRTAGSLLVIDRGEGIARGLERLLAGAASVKLVATPQEAAKVLAKEEVAAIVADMGTGMDGLVALFREVKAKRPEVLSILLTDEPDSELAIELINRAHIFRFLPKPVNAKELRTQVAAALRRYAAFKQIPTLADPAEVRPREGAALAERARALPGRPVAKSA